MAQQRDSRGRFLPKGTAGAPTQQQPQQASPLDRNSNGAPQQKNFPNSNIEQIENARGVFAKLIFGMTKVIDLGAAKAAMLTHSIASLNPLSRGTPVTRSPHGEDVQAPKGGKSGEDKTALGSVFSAVMGAFSNKLILTLAPLTAFATILNQSSSGFKVFLSAINVLAGTLAPILLPVFVLLSAALLTAADYIWNALQPALESFYTLIIVGGINAIQSFINWLSWVGTKLSEFGGALEEFGADAANVADDMSDDIAFAMAKIIDWVTGDNLADNIPQREKNFIKDKRQVPIDAPAQAADGGDWEGAGGDWMGKNDEGKRNADGTKKEKSVMDTFIGNVKTTIQEFKFQNSPKASFTGLASASRNAQLAAVNSSPFEKIMEKRMGEVLIALDKVADKLKPGMTD